jgi:hypothetical protein
MRHLFTAGIFALIGLISFALAYFFKHLMGKNLTMSFTLLIVAIALVKMLEIRDSMFE